MDKALLRSEWDQQIQSLKVSGALCIQIRPSIRPVVEADLKRFAEMRCPKDMSQAMSRSGVASSMHSNWLNRIAFG